MPDPNGIARVLADRYELGPLLGRGGSADVFEARDVALSRPVAVKVLRDSAGDESDRARFVSEARTLAGLSHSGLVTVLDAGFGFTDDVAGTIHPPDARPFLVMELVEGPTLAQRAGDPLPLEEVGAIGVQVADALAYVHRHGIVHRDVKPGNILLGPMERVRLADFGVARLLADTARHTRTGHTIGTAAYLAPEQVAGEDVSGAADVYSLGLVLFETITGRCEFPGSPTEAALARLHRAPSVPDDLPLLWSALLTSMVSRDPADRPTAEEVAEVLRQQPTTAIPPAAESAPEAMTVPLLAPPEPPPGDPQNATRVLPAPRPLHDRLGDSVARFVTTQAATASRVVRQSSESQRGLAVVLSVLVLFLVVVALLDGGSTGADREPANMPSELVEPMQQLHDAVEGSD
ncbi:serine/threonine-protein kinase [Nocardioides sp.]|uniref:serine/threonine-protein kinase n=1 Tax=Nocardioides sp. TaxID=35761 RepID=UPI002C8E2DB4|nr:serine/threonine-protein kinase [Nocardioides sp.]HXH80166.1 serine/threonine-protein kinase [Nocardioides sp.]